MPIVPAAASREDMEKHRPRAILVDMLERNPILKRLKELRDARLLKQLKTQDTLEYVYHPVPSRTLRFKVKASNDAHILLSEQANPAESDPVLEIFIGGWSNQKSAIRRDRTKPDKAVVDTPDVLSGDETRGFWVNYLGGSIAIGKETDIEPFLTWTDPAPINVNFFGIRTGYGASGEWFIDGSESVLTQDTLEYVYRPVPRYALDVHVRTTHDAHLALTSAPTDTQPMYEVFLGGWENTASAIRYDRQKPDKVRVDTPELLSSSEHRRFRVSWRGGVVRVLTGTGQLLMEWQDPATPPLSVSHFGVRSSWGATALWSVTCVNDVDGLDENYDVEPLRDIVIDTPDVPSAGGEVAWVPGAGGEIPPNAVLGGFDNENLYVGRATHEGAVIPGKVISSHGVCYVAWGGAEHSKSEYEVLTGSNLQWIPSVEGQVPPTAVIGGTSETGETLYIGRANHEGTHTIGKIQPSHSVCYIPYGGAELGYPEYDVLVQQ